eukprot:COSAG02_NODE_768_length_17375_cov_52.865015_1_plen_98_part_00
MAVVALRLGLLVRAVVRLVRPVVVRLVVVVLVVLVLAVRGGAASAAGSAGAGGAFGAGACLYSRVASGLTEESCRTRAWEWWSATCCEGWCLGALDC